MDVIEFERRSEFAPRVSMIERYCRFDSRSRSTWNRMDELSINGIPRGYVFHVEQSAHCKLKKALN